MELISRKGYERLIKKIKKIDEEISQAKKEMKESAKLYGTGLDNPGYDLLEEKILCILPNLRAEIIDRINNCQIIEETEEYKNFDGHIIPGTKVEMLFDEEPETYTILGDKESDVMKFEISNQSPIAKELLGKKEGDSLIFKYMVIKILHVERV